MSSLQFRGTRLDYAKCRLHMELGLQQRQPWKPWMRETCETCENCDKLWNTSLHLSESQCQSPCEIWWGLIFQGQSSVNLPVPPSSLDAILWAHEMVIQHPEVRWNQLKPGQAMSKTCQNCIEVMTFQDHQPLKSEARFMNHPVIQSRFFASLISLSRAATSPGRRAMLWLLWVLVDLYGKLWALERGLRLLQVLRKRARRRRSKSTSLNESCWKGEEPLWYVGTSLVLHKCHN